MTLQDEGNMQLNRILIFRLKTTILPLLDPNFGHLSHPVKNSPKSRKCRRLRLRRRRLLTTLMMLDRAFYPFGE